MTGLCALIRRNVKLYFKDKGMFLTSLITPVILLVLYVTFLGSVYEDMFLSPFKAIGITVPQSIVKGFVGGQLVSSILAVSCVTVAFCSNLLSVQDKTGGACRDFNVSPAKPSVTALGYYLSTLVSALTITLTAACICIVYLRVTEWYLSAADIAALFGDVVLLVLFGTALSSCLVYPMTTQGQASALGTVISAGYGFVCGAYMPISSFSDGLQKVMMFLPGTYGTSLMREHVLRGVFSAMAEKGFPAAASEALLKSTDCTLFFFGNTVPSGAKYAVLCGTVVLLVALYLMINTIASRRAKQKNRTLFL